MSERDDYRDYLLLVESARNNRSVEVESQQDFFRENTARSISEIRGGLGRFLHQGVYSHIDNVWMFFGTAEIDPMENIELRAALRSTGGPEVVDELEKHDCTFAAIISSQMQTLKYSQRLKKQPERSFTGQPLTLTLLP